MVPLTRLRRAFRLSVKVMRLSTFAAVVGGVLTIFMARSVYGSATESVWNLDQEWARRAGKIDQQSYRVLFNGQSMMTSSHMVEASMKDVLDEAEARCRAKSGGIEKDLAHLPGYAVKKLSSFMFGTVRRETGEHGFVACFENDSHAGLTGLSAGLREVARTGDLGKLGTFRYVGADRGTGATRTHVLRQWTEGSFNLKTLFPENGEPPGSDLTGVSRPVGSRRLLDASIEGSSFGVRIYDAPGTPAAVLARYDADMVKPRGWTRIDLTEKEAGSTRVYDAAGGDVFITATPNGDRSTVSIASMPVN